MQAGVGELRVTWTALNPAPQAGYRVQWKSGMQGYTGDTTAERCTAMPSPRYHVTGASATTYTITGLDDGIEIHGAGP